MCVDSHNSSEAHTKFIRIKQDSMLNHQPSQHDNNCGIQYCRCRLACLELQEDSMHRLRQSFAEEMERATQDFTRKITQGRYTTTFLTGDCTEVKNFISC